MKLKNEFAVVGQLNIDGNTMEIVLNVANYTVAYYIINTQSFMICHKNTYEVWWQDRRQFNKDVRTSNEK